MNKIFDNILTTIFKKKFVAQYYIDTVRVWEGHSFNTTLNCMSYAHPVFIIRKRSWFGEDKIVKKFYNTSRIEDALDELRKLNGTDFVPNEKAYRDYNVIHFWNATNLINHEVIEIANAESGIHVKQY